MSCGIRVRVSIALTCCVAGLPPLWMALSAATAAQQSPSGNAAASGQEERLQPAQVSVNRSRVYTIVGKTGLGHDHAVEGRIRSGHLSLGATSDAGEIVFDMNSFDADTDRARRFAGMQGSTDAATRQQVNANMRAGSILNVRQYPTATFVVSAARLLDQNSAAGTARYELEGKFTLCGTTRPLKFSVTAEARDGLTSVRGSFSILQTQYGITPFRKALGVVGVADRLTIHGDLWVAPAAGTGDAAETPGAEFGSR